MNTIDIQRSASIFNPTPYMPTIHVIGVGATGSHIWDQLTCLGYHNMVAWDFDRIEPHNLNNQTYLEQHIGMRKVRALRYMTKQKAPSTNYQYMPLKVTAETIKKYSHLFKESIIVLAIDTMAGRKELGKLFHERIDIKFMVEPRIASKHCNVYALPITSPLQYQQWYDTLGDDDDPIYETSPCGGSISVKPTITLASSLCVWAIIDWINEKAYDFGTNAFVSPSSIGYVTHDKKYKEQRSEFSDANLFRNSINRLWTQPPA